MAMAENIWQSLLQGIKAEKGTATRAMVLLGGTIADHDSIFSSIKASAPSTGSSSFQTGILGYGYIDFVDDDTGECTVRLEVHSLPEDDLSLESSDKSLQSALSGFLQDREDTTFADDVLFVVLGSWANEPRNWPRDILRSLHFILRIVDPLSEAHRTACISSIRGRVGEGEEEGGLDTPIPASVIFVAMQSNHITALENEKQYSDSIFDFIHQYLRTLLLKFGASFATVASQKASLDALGKLLTLLLHFPLENGKITAEPSNRTSTIIPQGWDSWTKIQVIDDKFDPATVSSFWNDAIYNTDSNLDFTAYTGRFPGGAVSPTIATDESSLQVQPMDYQTVLHESHAILESKKQTVTEPSPSEQPKSDLTDLTGPMDSNLGGIQLQTADTVARKLKQRELVLMQESSTPDRSFDRSLDQSMDKSMDDQPNTQPFNPNEMEVLTNFFHNILDDRKDGGDSGGTGNA